MVDSHWCSNYSTVKNGNTEYWKQFFKISSGTKSLQNRPVTIRTTAEKTAVVREAESSHITAQPGSNRTSLCWVETCLHASSVQS